jgi:hypothetical protein
MGNGYYSVCFFEEFIACVGALAGRMFEVGVVLFQEFVEEGCEV